MRFRSVTTSLAAVSVSALALAGLPLASAQTVSEFTVSNITDFHGRWEQKLDAKDPNKSIPGAVALKCAVDEAAAGRAHAFTSSGDLIGASPFASMILDDQPTIDIMNLMGLDVSAVGNHEFDRGADDLTQRIVPEADWTYLAEGAEGLDRSTGIKGYEIMDLDGVKVAFIGSVTDDMPNLVSPAGIAGITWENPVSAINMRAEALTASGEADVVIALPHEGNIDPSAWSDNVDAVFMGHTHQYVDPTGDSPLIIQAAQYSQGLANVNFTYDPSTDTLTVEKAELLRPADIVACDTPNAEIQAVIDTAKAAAAAAGAEVIGTLDSPLYRGANAGADSGSNRGVESQLNNLLANVAKWGVANNSEVNPDIAVMNAGGVRADLEAGEVTYADAFAVQPFGNEITYTTLKGADFKAALEQQWKKGAEGSRPMLSLGVSDNVSYTYDPTRADGDRITSVLIDGQPLDPAKDYVVAGSTFLLNGGDSFTALAQGTPLAQLGYIDIQAFTEYLTSYLGGGDAPAPRTGQSNVGVHIATPLVAGEAATIDLSSLIYTLGETAKTVTIELGDLKYTSDIDYDFGPADYNEAGKASLTFGIPKEFAGVYTLRITTDAGTDVTVPVTVEGAAENTPNGGSSFGALALFVTIIAGIAAAVGGFLPQILDLLRNAVPGLQI
ncbi:bifunctional metallophosphatase/5'-nucleotidase [Corynebacterium sanguinis]|uniref:bifunctional metallophosphatase/5'-nucleotidase n=1 Tax=Corynebacterium sanguinis TaxID=2594913 RepID=UPI00223B02FB|nr:bifunctional UDP-sugar hydrolase/5'-nucleotidase [Corynebacterium sanguinis]MCT1463835.1 bifunctional metallophosphatase/5'-nucleotidase [Corynebacterium sanguinis]MCT2046003.1 bifunctional metallophosphatase/5'-nucleotidase [Corynebacterium sanguinis]MCT2328762.1 bifunctional metallophosphatase/5'-nucleotidase [Corynebacterium sanguinis]MDN8577584.1 bifunctional UDP-sugar hydrolase/5'-nucleotidase [Corynebacterium sanguinis]